MGVPCTAINDTPYHTSMLQYFWIKEGISQCWIIQATGVDGSNLGKFHILRHVIRQRLARLLRYIVMLPFDITRANTPAGVNNLYVEQNHICGTHDGLRACCTEAHGMAFGPSHALY